MFKKLKGVKLSYEQQGFIRFTCLTYHNQPQKIKNKILNLCVETANEKYKALFELMTTPKTVVSISLGHFVSETTLYNLRRKFYHSWYEGE